MKYFDLKVGFLCNNDCIHCVIADKKATKDLTTSEIKAIIDKVPKDHIVGFTGGEATVRKDFLELIKYAKDAGHEVSLQTNGVRFADMEFATEAVKYLDIVLIAIHSHVESIHDAIVRGFGMYKKTIQGFKNLTALNANLFTQTVISSLNTPDLLETYDFIQSVNPGVGMNLTIPHPNGHAWTNSAAVVQKYSDIAPIIQACVSKYHEFLHTEAIPLCYLYPYQDLVANHDDKLLIDTPRPGLDPANTQAAFFNEEGWTENYNMSMLNEKRKGPKCIECVFNDRCVGVWKEYVDIYGKEFDLFPITADRLERDELMSQQAPTPTPKVEETKPEIVDERLLSPSQLLERYTKPEPVTSDDGCCCDEECDQESEHDAFRETQEAKALINSEWGAVIIYSDSTKCMNCCTFCSGSSAYEDPEVKFARLIDEIDFFLKDGIKKIEISGGDPGEYERIAEIILYLRENGVEEIVLSTHGRTLKDKALVEQLKLAGVSAIRMPFYGSTASIHNKTAQYYPTAGNAFEDTLAGLRNCVEAEIMITGFTLINQYNKEDINNIISLYLENTDAGKWLGKLYIGITFISDLNYSYTKDWFLPLKNMGPYVRDIWDNAPPLPGHTAFSFLDIPYCVLGEYTSLIENKFSGLPNLGKHKITELENRSTISDTIPHYRIKSYFDECERCVLNDICGAIPLNEIKMFGTYGLKAITEK
jgi:MoaA/NifB/PqqE/SkfB family radical SAM enzyme